MAANHSGGGSHAPPSGVRPGRIPDFSAGKWSKAALIRRFSRVEGQCRGLQRMVNEDREADELLMQIASIREALHGAAALILEAFLAKNAEAMLVSDDADEAERLKAKMIDVFRKWAT